MRAITLRENEIRALKTTGRVVVVRPVMPQPHICHNGDIIYKDRLIGSVNESLNCPNIYSEEIKNVCPVWGDFWVREWFRRVDFECANDKFSYLVEYKDGDFGDRVFGSIELMFSRLQWQSPALMPQNLSRFAIQCQTVRACRVQEVTEEEAKGTGVTTDCPIGYIPAYYEAPYSYAFAVAWDARYAKRGLGWGSNPHVWVAEMAKKG